MRRGAAASVTVLLLLLATGCNRAADARPGNVPSGASTWQIMPRAFPARFDWQSGPRVLLADPAGGCFLGYGAESDGYGLRPGYWRADGDCTRPQGRPAPSGPPPDGPAGEDRYVILGAVPVSGGDSVLIARNTYHNDAYGFDTDVLRGNWRQGWQPIAQFGTDGSRESHHGPHLIAAWRDRLVAAGQEESAAAVWTSADGGVTWQQVTLPAAGPGTQARFQAMVTGPDGRLVLLGLRADHDSGVGDAPPAFSWVSTDGGTTWRVYPLSEPGVASLSQLVSTGTGFVALGNGQDDARQPTVGYTSPDGVVWTRDDRAGRSGMRGLVAAVGLPDDTLLAMTGTGVNHDGKQAGNDTECARAWRYAAGKWTVEDLGCAGTPNALVALPDGRIAAARGTTLYLRARYR
jgi:hypothetical protein